MDIPYPEKIDLMTRWRIEFFSQMKDEFIRELFNLDEVVEEAKRRYLKNIADAQEKGEIRSDLSPELIWLVTERLNGLFGMKVGKQYFQITANFKSRCARYSSMGCLCDPKMKQIGRSKMTIFRGVFMGLGILLVSFCSI